MRLLGVSVLALLALVPGAARAADAPPVPAAPARTFGDVYNAALGGNMAEALGILDSLDASKWSAKDSTAAACLRQTFTAPPAPENLPPASQAILTAYREYWQSAMLRRQPVEAAQQQLVESLNTILAGLPPSRDLDAASETAKSAIGTEGLFALTGVTRPYYELMIWRKQEPRSYRVKLPERTIDVHVVFLDDFASLGWAGYATCGRAHSGGWATQDSLYALRSSYDLESENFRVSYLAHEGRHFSDYKEFPKLEQPELEYRGKLTEIAVSKETTYDLAVGFALRNGRDRAVPHHFANYCVARDLGRAVFGANDLVADEARWKAVPAEKLRSAAARLLKENSAMLKKRGAASVTRFLEAG
jgi:hypothetical protein